MLEKRQLLTPDDVREKSFLICRNIISLKQYASAANVLAYTAVRCEADIGFLIEDCFRTGRNVFLPVLIGEGVFEAREYRKKDALIKNAYGIPEPLHGRPAAPEELDFIVVPGVAFDRRLHRIGFGAGYYDRYLARAKGAYKVGAAFAFQVVESIQAGAHDIPLDAVATERDVLYRV